MAQSNMNLWGAARLFKEKTENPSVVGRVESRHFVEGNNVVCFSQPSGNDGMYRAVSSDADATLFTGDALVRESHVRFFDVKKFSGNYYAIGRHGADGLSGNGVYLLRSPDGIDWTVINNGQPFTRDDAPPSKWHWHCSRAFLVDPTDPTVWHFWFEANNGGPFANPIDFGAQYTWAKFNERSGTLTGAMANRTDGTRYAWYYLDYPGWTGDWVGTGATEYPAWRGFVRGSTGGYQPGTGRTLFIPERNRIVNISSRFYPWGADPGTQNTWDCELVMIVATPGSDLGDPGSWTEAPNFRIVGGELDPVNAPPHYADFDILELPAGKTSKMMISFSALAAGIQNCFYRLYSDSTLLEFFDEAMKQPSDSPWNPALHYVR